MPFDNAAFKSGKLEPEALNETNKLELYVFASDKHHQAVLVARLDNLGKGASGAAVQNMRLMLALPTRRQTARTKEGGGRVKPGHDGVLLKTP
jgi:N-acetyl-gamma-glutamyl-phosphate reductase